MGSLRHRCRALFFVPLLLAGCAVSSSAAHPPPNVSAMLRPPAFELAPLGVLGGDDDSNLSCWLLGVPGREPALMIDAGAFVEGLALWRGVTTHAARASATGRLFAQLDAVLITHAHLDHVSGLLLAAPTILGASRPTPLPVVGLPQVLDGLHTQALAAPLWVDFTRIPPRAAVLALAPLVPGAPQDRGPFRIDAVELVHPVPSAAFLISSGQASYLHLGDTGPTDEVWRRAAPLVRAGRLRGVSVEVSFPDRKQALALQTGHLTPSLLVAELAKLTGLRADPQELGRALEGVRIVAIHIKGADHDEVVKELQALTAAGLNVTVPERGQPIRF